MAHCSQSSDASTDKYDKEPSSLSISILEKTNKSVSYTIPSFPVIAVPLWRVELQWNCGEKVHMFSGFMRDCELLNIQLPAIANICHGHENAFFVEVFIILYYYSYLYSYTEL